MKDVITTTVRVHLTTPSGSEVQLELPLPEAEAINTALPAWAQLPARLASTVREHVDVFGWQGVHYDTETFCYCVRVYGQEWKK